MDDSLVSPALHFLPTSEQRLPVRRGPQPQVSDSPPGSRRAHSQLTQVAPVHLQEALFRRASNLAGVRVEPSGISVDGARAFVLEGALAEGPPEAFQVGREFAHIHPAEDGSLHMKLPEGVAETCYQRGWGQPHPRSATPMVYGPRDAAELEVVWQLLLRSYMWARRGEEHPAL